MGGRYLLRGLFSAFRVSQHRMRGSCRFLDHEDIWLFDRKSLSSDCEALRTIGGPRKSYHDGS
jgi:hypothetical protein